MFHVAGNSAPDLPGLFLTVLLGFSFFSRLSLPETTADGEVVRRTDVLASALYLSVDRPIPATTTGSDRI